MTLDIIAQLRELEPALKSEGATHLYVYGSRARGTERPDSDLDVFVEYNPETQFSLMELAGIRLVLEDEFDFPVSVTTRDRLHPMLREEIEREAVRVF
jgi:predicted nucleotidyltransferase